MTETFEEEKIKVPLNGPLIYAKKGTIQDTTDALLCHIHLNVCLWIMDPHHRAPKKNTSHGNEVLPQDTTYLIQRHNTNEEVRAKIQQTIGPHENLTIVKKCKLRWYGHVSSSSGLAKTILQGTVKGRRRQGGQRKRWEDNIREWTGLEFFKSQRAVENREKWRKLVAKLSVVPQRPSRLRDWWWWWWYYILVYYHSTAAGFCLLRDRAWRRPSDRQWWWPPHRGITVKIMKDSTTS